MKLVYFAWIRERIGKTDETVDLPGEVKTIGELLAWLKRRGDEYSVALESDLMVKVAVDHEHIDDRSFDISDAGEIALFPPMTGG